MNERNRMRMLWAMAAMVVVYAIVNVIVYFVSGSFGTGWFLTSLAVYGLVLVGALMLLVVDREPTPKPEEPAEEEQATAEPTPASEEESLGPEPLRVEVVEPAPAEPVRAS